MQMCECVYVCERVAKWLPKYWQKTSSTRVEVYGVSGLTILINIFPSYDSYGSTIILGIIYWVLVTNIQKSDLSLLFL